jgi:hypothetical protein
MEAMWVAVKNELHRSGMPCAESDIILRAGQILGWIREAPSDVRAEQEAALQSLLSGARRSALAEYNEAVESDGVSEVRWTQISDRLAVVSDAMRLGRCMEQVCVHLRDRAIDAAHNAVYIRRTVAAAREKWGVSCL